MLFLKCSYWPLSLHLPHTFIIDTPSCRPATGCIDADILRFREALYEDESFPERELAALVAAKVYYHLQEYNESMVFALGAGKLFQLDSGGEFEETIIGKNSRSPGICSPRVSSYRDIQRNASIPSSRSRRHSGPSRVTTKPI